MKVIIIGASGTIGKAVVKELSPRHTVVQVGKKGGDFQCNIMDEKSLHALFKAVAPFDAVVLTAGNVHFAPLQEMTSALYQIGLQDKLMGQVNAVLIGSKYINDKGSFTLTSGILARRPIVAGSSASMVSGALESFGIAAALELPKGLRINVISPTVLVESMPQYGAYFPGFKPVPASQVALAYSKSVEGSETGQIYRVD